MLIDIPNRKKGRIVIIGGGFGGITLAKKLKNSDYQVVLVDKNNYHTFQPLLYQVATSVLESDSIAYPIRKIFNNCKNVFFRMGEVDHLKVEEKEIVFQNGDNMEYDYLVIATGAKTNYLNNEGLTISSMPMKNINEALDLRSMVLQNFEKTLRMTNERKKQGMMNIVIAGAGPTGVELAGALGEFKTKIFHKDYQELDPDKMNIYLVQSGNRVLPMLSEKSSRKAEKYLKKLGVEVVLNTRVQDFFGDYVQSNTDRDLIARTLIWTAGVIGNPIDGLEEHIVTKNGRILVDEYNQIKGRDDIFAIGDVACMESEKFPRGHPMVAPPAMQQGKHLAKNLKRKLKGKDYRPFKYVDKGAMATVGKNRALVEVKGLRFTGFFAWITWMLLHLLYLVGFRNKFVTLLNWAGNYFNSDRGLRLIITPFDLYEKKRKRKIQMIEED